MSLGLLTAVAVVPPWFMTRRMEIRVVNETGEVLTSVAVAVSYSGGNAPAHTERRPALQPGKDIRFRPADGDPGVTISYLRGGKPRSATVPYIDLWAGESYRLTVRPDDSVDEAYEHR